MNAMPQPHAASGPARRTGVARRLASRSSRAVFPALLNVWPVLLLVSQKALVPLGLLLIGRLDRPFLSDVLRIGVALSVGLVVYLLQAPNEYATEHYVAFLLFLLAVILINAGIRTHRHRVVYWVAVLSVFNATLALLVYVLQIDLSGFRGLNRIVGDDDTTHRVYYETTSLLAVFSTAAIRKPVMRWLCWIVVLTYAVLLAKSFFVIGLFLIERLSPWMFRGRLTARLVSWSALIVAAITLAAASLILRPDFLLSVAIKMLQFETIAIEPGSLWLGSGWGYVIDEIVTSPEQPFQVEMQLPMLMQQIGVIGVTSWLVAMLGLFRSIGGSAFVVLGRWITYSAVGFLNPWLLVPSWYLTATLMYSSFESRKSP